MKNEQAKTKLLNVGLLIAALVISPLALAEKKPIVKIPNINMGHKNLKSKNTIVPIKKTDKVVNKKFIEKKELLKEVNQGASEAFVKINEAIQLINERNEKEALKLLSEASAKFDIALEVEPELGMTPIASEIDVTALNDSIDNIKAKIKTAHELLNDYQVQAARKILLPLVDEITSTTIYLPMATYPDAIKQAIKKLIDGKKDEALSILSVSLSTIVEETITIPLSLVRAESMIISASKLEKESKKDEATKLMKVAEEQLQLAAILGYAADNSAVHNEVFSQIKTLKKEIDGPNKVEKLYSKLKKTMKALISEKSKPKIPSSKIEEKEVKTKKGG